MKIIPAAPNPSGAYPPIQDGNFAAVPEGMAVWPDSLDTADFYAHNGFVTLTVEQVDGVPTVISYAPDMEAWEDWLASLPPEPEPEPTTEERLDTLEAEKADRTEVEAVWESMAAAYQEGVQSA